MQDRYTGDIGDFAKLGLLRALSDSQKIGVAWYLYPDEAHNNDGRHIKYLHEPEKWRHLDPALFDGLRNVVDSGLRNVAALKDLGLFEQAVFSAERLSFDGRINLRKQQRADWFQNLLTDLEDRSMIFADPDNGLCEDQGFSLSNKSHWKRLPLSEVDALTTGRTGIFYHHNTRRAGGHKKEINDWIQKLGKNTMALYWRRISNRTFFIVNPSEETRQRVKEFAKLWSPHFELVTSSSVDCKNCPECGYTFKGEGWIGIDAHWKAKHEDIMRYADAWPLIKAGKKPSIEV